MNTKPQLWIDIIVAACVYLGTYVVVVLSVIPHLQEHTPSSPTTILPATIQTVEVYNTETVEVDKKELECLAQNIYFEARSEPLMGKLAVGLTTINRVIHPKFPNTICDVVWQKRTSPTSGRVVAQFSWTLDGKPDRPQEQDAWDLALKIAGVMIANNSFDNIADFTNGSTHYHTNHIDTPYWGRKLIAAGYGEIQIGTHIFYHP